MPIIRSTVGLTKFNPTALYPHSLRMEDFQMAMQDAYDLLYDINTGLAAKSLDRLDEILRPAIMSGFLSDVITSSLGNHARALAVNRYHKGHPDLILRNMYPNNSVKSGGKNGVEIKMTQNARGSVDTHGARDQWFCVFVYKIDKITQPPTNRAAMEFTKIYLAEITTTDFRKNERGVLGTRTASLDKAGLAKLHSHWIYKL